MDEEKLALIFVTICALFVACVVLFTANAGDEAVIGNIEGLWSATTNHDLASVDRHNEILSNMDSLGKQCEASHEEQMSAINRVGLNVLEANDDAPLKMTASTILNAQNALLLYNEGRTSVRAIVCNDVRCFGEDS